MTSKVLIYKFQKSSYSSTQTIQLFLSFLFSGHHGNLGECRPLALPAAWSVFLFSLCSEPLYVITFHQVLVSKCHILFILLINFSMLNIFFSFKKMQTSHHSQSAKRMISDALIYFSDPIQYRYISADIRYRSDSTVECIIRIPCHVSKGTIPDKHLKISTNINHH